jgi:large subunit ribosomal protein L24e
MTKCVFCGKEEHDFKGVHLIKNDGTIDFYCSSKCRKNALKLKRDKRKIKWTQIYKTGLKVNAARKVANEARKIEITKENKKVQDAKDLKASEKKEAKKK